MGETSGSVIRQLSLGKPRRRQRRRLVLRAPRRGRAEGSGRRTRGRDAARGARAARAETTTLASAMGAAARRARPTRARPRPRRRALRRGARAGGGRRGGRGRRARRGRARRGRGRDRGRLARGGRARAAPRRGRAWSIGCARVPAWAWLAAIVVGSFALRAWLARGMVGAVHHGRRAHLLGARAQLRRRRRLPRSRRRRAAGFSLVYPLLISPAYALFDALPDAYAAVKTLNALLMSLAAVPGVPARPAACSRRRCRSLPRCSRSRSRRSPTRARS